MNFKTSEMIIMIRSGYLDYVITENFDNNLSTPISRTKMILFHFCLFSVCDRS